MISKSSNNVQVSIILPVYNCEKFIFESVKSILNQTFKYFELIILDDCSTDDTIKIIESSFSDQRMRIIKSSVNIGQSNIMNIGISEAKGSFLAVAHGDDINHPNRIEKQIEFFLDHPHIGVLGTSINFFFEEQSNSEWILNESSEYCKLELFSHVCFAHPTVMFNLNVVNKTDIIYNQEMVPAEDYELWTRLSRKYSFSNLKIKLVNYRIHQNQISAKKSHELRDKLYTIRLNYIQSLNLQVEEEKLQYLLLENLEYKTWLEKLNYLNDLFYLKSKLLIEGNFNYKMVDEFIFQQIRSKVFTNRFLFIIYRKVQRINCIQREYIERTKVVLNHKKRQRFLHSLKYIFKFSNEIRGKNVKIYGRKRTFNGAVTIGVNGNQRLLDKNRTIIENYGVFKAEGSCDIGKGTKIYINENANLEIGDRTFITGDTTIICHEKIIIGSNCAISWNVQIMDHDYHSIDNKPISKSIIIGSNVWIGSNTLIMKGVTIADGSVIAAGSVVTKSVLKPNCLIGGNPAVIIRENIKWKR
jgi:acetyltransferase-like isoleucine patch superfamily enzyme